MTQNAWLRTAQLFKSLVIVAASVFMVNCSSTHDISHPELKTARADFSQVLTSNNTAQNIVQYLKLRQTYALFADVEYLIKTDLLLAKLYHNNQQMDESRKALAQCYKYAQVPLWQKYLADCYLLEYQQSQSATVLDKFINAAQTQRQMAYVYYYQQNYSKLKSVLAELSSTSATDAAWLYYQLGYDLSEVEAIKSALKLAQQHKQVQLITDSLFLLSKIYWQQRNLELTHWYYALAVDSAKSHAPTLLQPMQKWFDSTGLASE